MSYLDKDEFGLTYEDFDKLMKLEENSMKYVDDIGATENQNDEEVEDVITDGEVVPDDTENHIAYDTSADNEEQYEIDTETGNLQFDYVDHSSRIKSSNQITDGEVSAFVNVALEYFNYRCALSGEKFFRWDDAVSGKRCNLSAEHMVPLTLGGDDIVPNLFPTVLQYNLQKNGHNPLDYWKLAKDKDGHPIYNPYRLLKVINYMLKASTKEARECVKNGKTGVKKFRKIILEQKNAIDIFLEEIEQNQSDLMYSEVETSITMDADNKKVLVSVGELGRNIPTQKEQEQELENIETAQNSIRIMDIFINDAVREIENSEQLSTVKITDADGNLVTIREVLETQFKQIRGKISQEIGLRNRVLDELTSFDIMENQYTIANTLVQSPTFFKLAIEDSSNIKKCIDNCNAKLKEIGLTDEQVRSAISSFPEVLYSDKMVKRIAVWKKYRNQKMDSILKHGTMQKDNLIDALLMLKEYNIDISLIPWRLRMELNDILNYKLTTTNKSPINTDGMNESEIRAKLNEINQMITYVIGDVKLGGLLATHRAPQYRKSLKDELKETGAFSEAEINALFPKKNKSDLSERTSTEKIADALVILKEHQINIKRTLPWGESKTLQELFDYKTIIGKKIMPINDMTEAEIKSRINKMVAQISDVIGEDTLGKLLHEQLTPKNLRAFEMH